MRLNHRVTLRIPVTQIVDSLEKVVYIDGATVWASVQPLRGREYWQAQQIQNEGIIKIILRYTPNIKNEWKIQFENVEYAITNIGDINMKHTWLEIYCKVVS